MKNENDNLIKLPVKDLAKKVVSDGHLFLSIGGRKFYVMKPGIFIDESFIKKHAVTNPAFDFQPVINYEVKEHFRSFFKELKYLQFEKDLRLKCFDILKYFYQAFSQGEHFLSFALACHEEFCQLSHEQQSRINQTDMHLYRKALYSSAFSIITGMANDFYNYQMLRDFYNLTFSLDVGLCDSNYSFYVAEACNAENTEPGSGIRYLEMQKASQLETDTFLKHPQISYEFVKQSSILSYPGLAEVALYQHELADGKGFPRGIQKGQVSSWEAIVIFADSLVDIASEYKFENDVISYMTQFHNKKLSDLPVNKVYKKLCGAFEHFCQLRETGT